MTGKTPPHVLPRDGSQNLGGPPPRVAPKPSATHEAETGIELFGGTYTDPGTVGHFPLQRDAFDAAAGEPSPRQLAQRERGGGPTKSTTPKDLPPAPLG